MIISTRKRPLPSGRLQMTMKNRHDCHHLDTIEHQIIENGHQCTEDNIELGGEDLLLHTDSFPAVCCYWHGHNAHHHSWQIQQMLIGK